jgi:hypothetical protein
MRATNHFEESDINKNMAIRSVPRLINKIIDEDLRTPAAQVGISAKFVGEGE